MAGREAGFGGYLGFPWADSAAFNGRWAADRPLARGVAHLGDTERQRNAAEFAFADMIADTERLGLYDVDPDEARAALKAARKKTQG